MKVNMWLVGNFMDTGKMKLLFEFIKNYQTELMLDKMVFGSDPLSKKTKKKTHSHGNFMSTPKFFTKPGKMCFLITLQ